jgi:ribonucleoside-triphosphate reductase (thioredoxin)
MSILSDIAFYRTYAKVLPNGHKENWSQVCERYLQFWLDRTHIKHHDLLADCVELVKDKRVVPSMRMLQFAGIPIERESARAYNCSFLNIVSFKCASELLYLAACGVGVGYSIQRHHIQQCEPIGLPQEGQTHVIEDTRESWADSITHLLTNPNCVFDYSRIRPAGSSLSTGGTSSGAAPLRLCHDRVRTILLGRAGERLTPFEWHVVLTSIGDAIVAGGVRRTALIALFDRDDEEMLNCKSGLWWEKYPQFARANNSAVLPRTEVTQEEFNSILTRTYNSYSGEPGILWTNDKDMGTNPCAEIALQSNQLCNLTEVNMAACTGLANALEAIDVATILGTFQATLDTFGYLSPEWKKNCEKERLLGVSLTGQAQASFYMNPNYLRSFAGRAVDTNRVMAHMLGINQAARITTTKPSGTTSTVLDTSAGVHGVHAPYYVRRIGIEKGNPLEVYLKEKLTLDYVEECSYDSSLTLFAFPVQMDGIVRTEETAVQLLDRASVVQRNWVKPGHIRGANSHNVSLTVSYKESERDAVRQWMWDNREDYGGISLLPFDGHTYKQAPYETITADRYAELAAGLPRLDASQVLYTQADDSRNGVAACEGDKCELPERKQA